MKLGIVILNYNGWENTIRLANAISQYQSISNVVVVDNCSTDDSLKQMKMQGNGRWILLASNENGGYAKGNNIGARYLADVCHADIIGIANPDVSFSDDFCSKIKSDMEKLGGYSVITGVQKYENGDIMPMAFWQERTCAAMFLNNFLLLSKIKRHFTTPVTEKIQQEKGIFEVPVVCGALFFIRAADFQRCGYFDEGTFLFYEEDILACKIHRMNKKIGIDTTIEFRHAGSATIDKMISFIKGISIDNDSKKYYFDHYVSSNWIMQRLFRMSIAFSWVEQICLRYPYLYIKKLIGG